MNLLTKAKVNRFKSIPRIGNFMSTNIRFACCTIVWIALMLLGSLTAQAIAQDVPQTVTFSKRAAVVGDGLDQTIEFETAIKIRTREAQQVIKEEQVRSGRKQHRQVTARVLEAGRVVEVEVTFLASAESRQEIHVDDPVVGKTYRCVRSKEDLQIFGADGQIPPMAEFKVVAAAMESLGKPNPLADFLQNRQLSVGEQLTLPNEVAQQVFGLDKKMGTVEKFALKLTSIESIDGRLVANFDADVEATGSGSTQMRLVLTGPLVIECATCRVVTTELSGPIGMLESRGSLGHTYYVDGTGKLHLKIVSRYRDLK